MLLKYATGAPSLPTGYTLHSPVQSHFPALFKNPIPFSPHPRATKNPHLYEGLGDSGGAIAITVNDYDEFRTAGKPVSELL